MAETTNLIEKPETNPNESQFLANLWLSLENSNYSILKWKPMFGSFDKPILLSGEQLKLLSPRFFKFVARTKIHHNFEYQLGLNEEKNFSPYTVCSNGLYFVPVEWGNKWLHFYKKKNDFVAEITIPDDATAVIFPNDHKIKANKIIVKSFVPRKKFDMGLFTRENNIFQVKNPSYFQARYVIEQLEPRLIHNPNDLVFFEEPITRGLITIREFGLKLHMFHHFGLDVSRDLISKVPPEPETRYDRIINYYDLEPSYLPQCFLNHCSFDRCLALMVKRNGYVGVEFITSRKYAKILLDNIEYFRSKSYWKGLYIWTPGKKVWKREEYWEENQDLFRKREHLRPIFE